MKDITLFQVRLTLMDSHARCFGLISVEHFTDFGSAH
jgi:hypothetical protein